MAQEAGIVSNAKARPDKAAHEDKGADHGDQDVKPHIGFGGEALFLHELPAAVDDQYQCCVAEKADQSDHTGRRTVGGI